MAPKERRGYAKFITIFGYGTPRDLNAVLSKDIGDSFIGHRNPPFLAYNDMLNFRLDIFT